MGARATQNGVRTKMGLGCPLHQTLARVGWHLRIIWGADICLDEGHHPTIPHPGPQSCAVFLPPIRCWDTVVVEVASGEGRLWCHPCNTSNHQTVSLVPPTMQKRRQEKVPSPPRAQATARPSVFCVCSPRRPAGEE